MRLGDKSRWTSVCGITQGKYSGQQRRHAHPGLDELAHQPSTRLTSKKDLDLIDENIDAAAEVKLVLNDSDKGMLNPRNKFRITWDLCIVFPLLIYLAILLPFRLCFGNEPPLFSAVYWFEFLIDKLFIVDSKKHQK